MRLTSFTDYSLRVLIFLAINPGRHVSTQEIGRAYNISHNHLVKVVHNLGKLGYVQLRRGRHGGITLDRNPVDIVIGQVVRQTEADFFVADCFRENHNECPIKAACGLIDPFQSALDAFLNTLDQYTLQDILNGNYQKYLNPPK